MQRINAVLHSLGLNDKESALYLALLSVGSSPASLLARRTGLTRSMAQYTCQQLVRKKLATMIERNNTYIYTPEPPEKLLYLLEQEQESLQDKEQQVHAIIGSLKQMINPQSTLPKVQFYEGKNGMIDLYDRILDLRKPIDSFEEAARVFELFPDYAHEFMKKRIDRKIFNRCIAPSGSAFNVTSEKRLIEVRLIDPTLFPFSCHIKISGDIVGVFSFERDLPVGVGIRHQNIADNFRLIFENLWRLLPPGDEPSTKGGEQPSPRGKKNPA